MDCITVPTEGGCSLQVICTNSACTNVVKSKRYSHLTSCILGECCPIDGLINNGRVTSCM